jgi:uncharacterized membrane protein YdjX (TVP38/TMEM64 family)
MIKDLLSKYLKKIKNNKTVQIGLMTLFITAVILVMVFFDLESAQAFIRAHRGQATLISIVLIFVLALTFMPTTPLTFFLAVFLSPVEAILITTAGHTLASFLEYKIGATMGDLIDFDSRKDNLPFGLGDLPMTSPYLLMAARLLPGGYLGFSIVCGAYQVPFGKYLWTSVLMYMLNSSFVAFGGAWLARLF